MPPLPLDPRLERVFAYIDENLERDIPVAELAKFSGLSPARFSHLFALASGVTPGRYIKLRRTGSVRMEIGTSRVPGRQTEGGELRVVVRIEQAE
jgi:transcriptional regulator GlxA family with amidase domain